MRVILLFVLLLGCSALAQVFECDTSFDYSLSHRTLSSWTDGDLHVSVSAVSARYGVRRRSSLGSFQSREVVVLGESYELRDAVGESWVMTIHRADAHSVRVQLSRVTGRPDLPPMHFRVGEVIANGAPADVKFGDLDLKPDGTYVLNGAHGGYVYGAEGVALDGGHASWGKGKLSPQRTELIFKYQRGPIQWLVKYERVEARALTSAESPTGPADPG